MAYQFTQTGAEIQDILDQVGTNTGDIAQNTQDIGTLNSNLTNINSDFQENASTAAVNISSSQWTKVLELTLDPGMYLINYGGAFTNNSSGYRAISLGSTSASGSGRRSPCIGASASDQTRLSGARLVNVSVRYTYGLWASQNSGATLQFYPWYECIKLR